jgi:hypothetical protein
VTAFLPDPLALPALDRRVDELTSEIPIDAPEEMAA